MREHVRELADAVTAFGDRVELDAEAFAALEARLGDLFALKRRYGPTLEQVLSAASEAETRLDDYRRGDEKRAAFKAEAARLDEALAEAAAALSAKRKPAAERFASEVGAKLAGLGFASGKLVPAWEKIEPGPNGADRFEWLFAPNPGEPSMPLAAIASSGEIARVMLAVKSVLAEHDSIPVLVFDEIDSNIGGETGRSVGEKLHRLSESHQVVPQVAAFGDAHFSVAKRVEDGRTLAGIRRLSDDERTRELARMLGGADITSVVLAHARELLAGAAKRAAPSGSRR